METIDDDKWVPIMTKQLPATNTVLHLVKCACVKSTCSANQCSCRKVDLNCTDLCSCSEGCENMEDEHEEMVADCDHEDDLDENDVDYIQYDDDDGQPSSD